MPARLGDQAIDPFGKEPSTEERMDLILILSYCSSSSGAVSVIPGGDMAVASVSAVFC
jgi:hypothetical protein